MYKRQGLRNEIKFDIFSRAALEPTFRGPITVFLSALGGKGSQSGAQWAPISIKNRLKVVSGTDLVSHWLPDAPGVGQALQKGTKSAQKSMISGRLLKRSRGTSSCIV